MPANKHKEWYIGVDLGTGSCKSVIIDADAQILGFGAGGYSKVEAPTGWKEQDPETLIDALIRSVRNAVDRAEVSPQACQGMSVGGALHSLIAIDKSRKPLTGILTWIDARAVNQAAAVRTAGDAHQIYRQTGCPVHSMYPLYKLIWLREKKPGIFNKADRFVSAKTYVIERRMADAEGVMGIWMQVGVAMENEITLMNEPTNTQLEYHVYAMNSAGLGPMSNTVYAVL